MKKLIAWPGFFIAFAVSCAFAQKGRSPLTVREFCALTITEETDVKITDMLTPSNIHELSLARRGEDGKKKPVPVNLDLSECTFPDERCQILITNLQNVRTLELPKATRRIEVCGAADLERIVLPDGLEYIEAQAFMHAKLVSVKIPESVQYVGACAFGLNEELRSIQIGTNPHVADWSRVWNAWNDAEVRSGETVLAAGVSLPEPAGCISFSNAAYQFYTKDSIGMEIRLEKTPAVSGNARLVLYDANNKGAVAGSVALKLKKKQKKISVQGFPVADLTVEETDLYWATKNAYGDYWLRLHAMLEFDDGTRLPLFGYALVYEAGLDW
ncbi:MAG: leucine-rich repeat domain-containing protein [Treponema sp.]|nr:leucine-rich repeat domain-containing protein [Treponema sp.]